MRKSVITILALVFYFACTFDDVDRIWACSSNNAIIEEDIIPGCVWITIFNYGFWEIQVCQMWSHPYDDDLIQTQCTSSLIEVFENPDATITPAGPFCEYDPPINLVSATPGGIWTGEGITDTNAGTFDPAVAGIGNHEIIYSVNNQNSCHDIDEIIIDVNPVPEVNINSNSPVCKGEDINLTETGGDAVTWSWSGPNNFSSSEQSPIISESTTDATGYYYVTVTDINGCTNSDNVYITVYPNPTVNAGSNSPICVGEDINLSATCDDDDALFEWSGPNNFSSSEQSPIISESTTDATGYYFVTITDINGCTNSDNVYITVYPNPTVNAGSNSPICEEEDINLTETGGDAISWSWFGLLPYPYEFSSTNQNPVITSANTGFSGNYYVTVTDTHGCTNTDVVNVVVNENITPDFDQFGPYCEGEEMYVLPNSSDNGVTGTWNPAAINTNIIGTTTYTFTPDEGQCAEIITMDIEVLPSPTASFTISGCPVINTSLSILNNSYDANSYQWYVNNEYIDVAPGADPNIILAEPGYHCIKLVATNECGSDTYSTVIFVNSGICACDESDGGYYNYDYTDGYTIFSNSTETWSSTETIYVQGDIFIQSNAILIIGENTRIEFAPDGRIIVEAGGKLIIESNVVLTGLSSDCQNMWQGIEVWGDNDNVYSEDAQGIVEIHKDNVKIEHAHIGILSGARNMDYICDPETNPFDDEPGSGLVRIGKDNPEFNNPEFYNNGIGIKFLERDPIIYMGLTWSGNILYDCNFSSDELRDYHYSTTSTNPYPNAQNPWAGYANSSRRTDAGINIEGIYRMNITNCNFDNLQHGILSFDSKYNVFNCNFTNAHFGIKINNVNSGVDFNHEISRCFFDRIPGYEPPSPPYYFKSFTAAIYIMAGKNDYIHDNTFGYMDTYQEFNQYGIFTSSTSSFRITENLFKKFKHGIKINNSGEDGGFIGAEETNESYWYGNRFNASWRSITTGGDNSKLKLKCNVCDNNLAVYQPELYDVNYMTYGVLADQGYPPYQGWQFWNVRKPAGNEFYPENEPNYKTLWSNYSYTYYRHNGPPEVIPYVHDESPEWINIDGTNILNKPDNDVACLAPFLIPLPLPILITSNPGGLNYPYNQLDSLKQVTDSLKLVLEDINASLDNGKTYQLLDAIYGNTPPGQLKNKLMKNSPLSDTVIYALLTEYPLPHGNFKNVMDINLPVRKGLRSLLYSVLQQIPQGIANQLYALQANYPGSMTPGRIEQEIDNTETERQLLLNHILILLNDTVHNRRDDAIFLLENEESLSADKILISTYIADGDYDLAASKLAALPTNDHDNADFVTLHQMLLSHYEQGNTLYQLDSSEIDLIRTLAYQCPVNLASANAQSILYYLFREVIPECPAQMGAKNMPLTENHPVIIKAKKDNPVLEDNYPDPATVYTIMPYYLPEGSLGKIEIHDLQGRLLASYKLSSGKNQVYVDTKNLYPGVYLYSLNINGVTYITKKFVVQ